MELRERPQGFNAMTPASLTGRTLSGQAIRGQRIVGRLTHGVRGPRSFFLQKYAL
jgi:hypothetical protein